MQISEDYANAYADLLRTRIYTVIGVWIAISVVWGVIFGLLHEFLGVSKNAFVATTLPLCMLCLHLLDRQQQRRLAAKANCEMDADADAEHLDNPSATSQNEYEG